MSKERKFHQLIEQLDREEKDRVWQKIKQKEDLRMIEEGKTIVVKYPSKKFSLRKVVAVCTTFILVIVGIVGLVRFLPKEESVDNGAGGDSIGNEQGGNRYCDSSMYTVTASEKTLKEIAELGDETILYLDWYDVTDYYETSVYQMNGTAEIIGYYEEMVDINTGSIISIHTIFDNYLLESLDIYGDTDRVEYINGVEIHWASVMEYSYANFDYGTYQYFIIVEYPMAENSVLDIINELFV